MKTCDFLALNILLWVSLARHRIQLRHEGEADHIPLQECDLFEKQVQF